MSKKETIESKVKNLKEREEKVKLQMDFNSEEVKSKALQIGKIALISGLVAIIGYWIYKSFFSEEKEEKEIEETKVRPKSKNHFWSRIGTLAIPYVEKAIEKALTEEKEEEKHEKKSDVH